MTATNWEVRSFFTVLHHPPNRFQIELEFKISGEGHLNGDGFAMWLTKQRAQPGPVFGSVDSFEGLGIFFDTYKNNRPGTVFPYVMAMLGDGNTPYDAANDGKANELAGCSARGMRNALAPTKARLTYFQDQNLVMELQYKQEGVWEPCFDVPDVKIPNVAYLGFSAETGELSDNFDIISVNTNNLYSSGGPGATAGSTQAKSSSGQGQRSTGSYNSTKSSGSWSWFFLKVILFFVTCGGGYVGFTLWRTSKRSSRF